MKRTKVIAKLNDLLTDWDWWWGDKELIEEAIRYLEARKPETPPTDKQFARLKAH